MESISILSLNADCLYSVVSYLDDFSSFYSFCLTCKRFKQLAEDDRNWHINVLKRKAEFYTRKFIVYSGDGDYESRGELQSLLEEVQQCSIDRLSYSNVHEVWKSCGPVAAKFFSWIKSSRSVTRREGPRATCSTKYAEQTFHLPICGEELSIATSQFVDNIWNYDQETNFKVSCGDLKIENEVSKITPEDYNYWDKEEMRTVVDPMIPVIELLQKELGDTVPPITDKFFVWMCFRFPSLKEEHKIYFKDETKNAIPTLESLQPILARYRQNKAKQIEKLVQEWLHGKDGSQSANQIARALEILTQKSQTAILTQLREDVDRFSNVISNKDLRMAPQKMMLDLVTRTTLFRGNYSSGAFANKHVDNKAHFRMKGGSVIKIDGEIHGYVVSYHPWDELKMTFSLPDGSKVEIPRTNIIVYWALEPIDQGEYLIKTFSPITEILQECIDESMKDEENIPKIQNIFTFYYFLAVMQFSEFVQFFKECKQDLFESSDESELDSDFSD